MSQKSNKRNALEHVPACATWPPPWLGTASKSARPIAKPPKSEAEPIALAGETVPRVPAIPEKLNTPAPTPSKPQKLEPPTPIPPELEIMLAGIDASARTMTKEPRLLQAVENLLAD